VPEVTAGSSPPDTVGPGTTSPCAEVVRGRTKLWSTFMIGAGRGRVLVLLSAAATISPEEGSTENVVPDPTAAESPATIVIYPPTTTSGEPFPSWNVTPGTTAINAELLAGAGVVADEIVFSFPV
jgi:hypothetical protein